MANQIEIMPGIIITVIIVNINKINYYIQQLISD